MKIPINEFYNDNVAQFVSLAAYLNPQIFDLVF